MRTILLGQFFFIKRFYTQKKNTKKHISKYALTKHSNKKLLIYILCPYAFL